MSTKNTTFWNVLAENKNNEEEKKRGKPLANAEIGVDHNEVRYGQKVK